MVGELPSPSPQSAYLGLVTAVAILTGFALPPLLQLGSCRRSVFCDTTSNHHHLPTA